MGTSSIYQLHVCGSKQASHTPTNQMARRNACRAALTTQRSTARSRDGKDNVRPSSRMPPPVLQIRRRLKKLGVVAAKQKKRQQQKGARGKQ